MLAYSDQLDRIRLEGTQSTNPLAFRHYNPDEIVLGKRMEDHLRSTACYWHTFCWNGADMFGMGAFDRLRQQPGEVLALVKHKVGAVLESFHKLNVSYCYFYDVDVLPEGASLKEYRNNFMQMVNVLTAKQEQNGVRLLWDTANCFTNPRYGAGTATNSDPEVFSWAATQVITAMDTMHRLGGKNYVLRGDHEGYETLLNTDLRQEHERVGRFMQLVIEYKHKIGFQDILLIGSKPQEPTKHQYDYDAATAYGPLKQFGLEKEVRLDIEASHATPTGYLFHHEIAATIVLGLPGSVDANRGGTQLDWDTGQFPSSVEKNVLVMHEILKMGDFTTGDLNSDAKVRRQSTDKYDLFYDHTSAMGAMVLSLGVTARMTEDDSLDQRVAKRYAGWGGELDQRILKGQTTLTEIA